MLCAPGPLQKQEAGQCRSQQKGICQEGGLPPKPAGDETGTYPAQEGPEHGGRGIDGHGPLQGLLPAVQGDVRHQGQQDGRDQQPGALLVGSIFAAIKMAGYTGFSIAVAIYFLNESLGRPVQKMAAPVVAVMITGILLNVLYWLGLFVPA